MPCSTRHLPSNSCRSPLGKTLAGSTKVKQLAKFETDLKALLDLDWKQIREDILGDAVVLAYRPGPPGKPEQEQGLILLHAHNAETAGPADRTTQRQAEGVRRSWKRWTKSNSRAPPIFNAPRRRIPISTISMAPLCYSPARKILKEALAARREKGRRRSGDAPLAQPGSRLALLSLWVNPRGSTPNWKRIAPTRTRPPPRWRLPPR